MAAALPSPTAPLVSPWEVGIYAPRGTNIYWTVRRQDENSASSSRLQSTIRALSWITASASAAAVFVIDRSPFASDYTAVRSPGRKVESSGTRRWRPSHPVLVIGLIYLVFVSFKFHHFLEIANALSGDGSFSGLDRPVNDLTSRHLHVGHRTPVLVDHDTFHRRLEDSRNLPPALEKEQPSLRFPPIKPFQRWFGHKSIGNLTQLQAMVNEAWVLGQKAWDDVKNYDPMNSTDQLSLIEGKLEPCPSSLAKSLTEMGSDAELLVFLPCGLAAGSSITVVGKPQEAHKEHVTKLARMRQADGSGTIWVSQFVVELQGLRVVDGEDPPKILHLNPRLMGDWSKKPVLELNSCYRMQWGTSIRCNGLPSGDDDDTGNMPLCFYPHLVLINFDSYICSYS
ncbi:hypothetical protein GW17_00023029 [Ensete ventricosum]|nr:hypothetical protein GW17_00023029 [Ensete ventricosum]